MIGVALACYGEMDINVVSFTVTAFCVLLAALKVLLSGEMLTGSMKVGLHFPLIYSFFPFPHVLSLVLLCPPFSSHVHVLVVIRMSVYFQA